MQPGTISPTQAAPSSSDAGEPRWTERLALLAAVGILVAVAATRLDSTALWADEAWSLAAANHLRMSLTATSGTMGGYYVLLWLWARAGTGTVWLRLLSTCCAVGTLVVTQAIARRVGGRRLASVAPLLLVCSPMFIWTGTEARGYALETLLAACCWYAAVRLIGDASERGRTAWSVAFVVFAALGPMAHGLFLAQLIPVGLVALLGRDRRTQLERVGPALLVGLVVTMALWAAGLSSAGSVHTLTPAQMFGSLRGWFLGPVNWVGWLALAVAGIGLAAALRDTIEATGHPARRRAAVGAAWALVPLIVLLIVRAFHTVWADYYLAPATPGVALLIGMGALALDDGLARVAHPRAAEPGRGALRAATAPLGLVLVGVLGFALVHQPRRPVEGWRGAARLVADQARPGDGIVFAGGLPDNPIEARAPFEAAWREVTHPVVPDAVSPRRPLGDVRRVDHYLDPAVARARSQSHARVWVVDYSDVMSTEHFADRPPLSSRFRLALDRTFAGSVHVQLFVRTS